MPSISLNSEERENQEHFSSINISCLRHFSDRLRSGRQPGNENGRAFISWWRIECSLQESTRLHICRPLRG